MQGAVKGDCTINCITLPHYRSSSYNGSWFYTAFHVFMHFTQLFYEKTFAKQYKIHPGTFPHRKQRRYRTWLSCRENMERYSGLLADGCGLILLNYCFCWRKAELDWEIPAGKLTDSPFVWSCGVPGSLGQSPCKMHLENKVPQSPWKTVIFYLMGYIGSIWANRIRSYWIRSYCQPIILHFIWYRTTSTPIISQLI